MAKQLTSIKSQVGDEMRVYQAEELLAEPRTRQQRKQLARDLRAHEAACVVPGGREEAVRTFRQQATIQRLSL